MDDKLRAFLAQYQSQLSETVAWYDGKMPLRIDYYRCAAMPPPDFITSVRAVLFHGSRVMVVRDVHDSYHVVPGGRREAGETIQETLRWEVLEETGSGFY